MDERERYPAFLTGRPPVGDEYRGYDPLHREGWNVKRLVSSLWGAIVAVGLAALKFGAFMIKFFGLFISIGAYTLIWGPRFAIGFVLLILVHELGHYVEARRQGLHPALPVFVPFLGAYVAIKDAPRDPWRNGWIAIAGPIAGGLGALGVWIAAGAMDSRLLFAIAYSAFFLNLINLLPLPILDGGFVLSSLRALWRGPQRDLDPFAPPPERTSTRGRALTLGVVTVALIAFLVYGMIETRVPQDRL